MQRSREAQVAAQRRRRDGGAIPPRATIPPSAGILTRPRRRRGCDLRPASRAPPGFASQPRRTAENPDAAAHRIHCWDELWRSSHPRLFRALLFLPPFQPTLFKSFPIRVEIWLKFKYEVPGSKNLDPSRKLRAGQPQALPSDEDDGSGGSCGGGCARRQNVGHDNDNTPSSSCFVPATTSRGGAFTTFGRSCDREANGQNLLRTVGGPRTLRGLRCVCVDDGVRE